jgi:DNA polymerase elongation subunit (family B)
MPSLRPQKERAFTTESTERKKTQVEVWESFLMPAQIFEGWIFDLYPSPQGMTLWLITPNQTRHRLVDRFAPAFYVWGPDAVLRRLRAAIARQPHALVCRSAERIDLWEPDAAGMRLVLEIEVAHPSEFPSWTRWVRQFDPALRLYNSDLMLASLYCWQRKVFPLARVEAEADAEDRVLALSCRDTEWAIDYEPPPLEVLRVRLGGLKSIDPRHGEQTALEIEVDGREFELDESGEPAAVAFQHLLARHDPDLILSDWGDATILPKLREQAAKLRLSLSLNRDPAAEVHESRARSYMSYGRILFKNSATTLFGRLHVDTQNSFIADKCDLSGLWELARVTKLPVQYCARTSTGTGISYMQMELAWRDGVLIPEQKAEPEDPKPPDELLLADRGGLVFTPKTGFHANVAELDFVSEYPSIMARFNISPETVNCPCCPDAARVPELGYRVCQKRRGITSRVVEQLIAKRAELKQRIAAVNLSLPALEFVILSEAKNLSGLETGEQRDSSAKNLPQNDNVFRCPEVREEEQQIKSQGSAEQKQPFAEDAPGKCYKLQRDALKWLLVCCFGYTGYKNARFGKIEAHEAINAVARETLLVSKEIAEDRGYEILHALVDSLYVHKAEATRADYEALTAEIAARTELPLAIEAIYRYVVFLPSRQFEDVPVPNRFFAVAEDGALKVRGLELRRHDTPPLVARMQQEVLEILAEARDFDQYLAKVEEAREILRRAEESVADGSVAIEDLIISKRLTREPREYSKANQTAIAAQQLFGRGVRLRPGQTVEYIITDSDNRVPNDRVRAYALWDGWFGYDRRKYTELLHDAFDPLALARISHKQCL